MSNLFVHSFNDGFFLSSSVLPEVVYCLDIDSFIDSCASGHACAMSTSVFNEEHTDYQLALVESRLSGFISSDLFHSRLALLSKTFKVIWDV